MKNSAHYAELLKKLCNRLKRQAETPVEFPSLDATATLVLAILSEVTTESKALTVLNRIQHYFVDFNEVRVCGKDELTEVLGKNFPQARQRAGLIISILNQIYNKLDCLDLDILHEGGKREAKAFLESLENITPYIVYSVMMHSFGAHAFPVNDTMMKMLQHEQVIASDADVANVQGFLKRQTQASQIREVYTILRHHADNLNLDNLTDRDTDTKKTKVKTKKTATKKTTNKKTAKKVDSQENADKKAATKATKKKKTTTKKTIAKKTTATKTTRKKTSTRKTKAKKVVKANKTDKTK